jgi:hypothetical protein
VEEIKKEIIKIKNEAMHCSNNRQASMHRMISGTDKKIDEIKEELEMSRKVAVELEECLYQLMNGIMQEKQWG